MRTRGYSCSALVILAAACGGSPTGGDDDDDGGGSTGPLTVALPQAHAGAFGASPWVYETVPVRVVVEGDADDLTVTLDGVEITAERETNDWVARVPLAAVADGTYELTATATNRTHTGTATATLVVSAEGTGITQIARDGNAGTPRIFDLDGHWHLTWTDARDGSRKVRIAELDGAGRFIGEPRTLLSAAEDIVYARTAMGPTSVGILFQHPGGGPYKNFFTVVDRAGTQLVAPIALNPDQMYGSYGGDVVWTGDAYVLIYRVNNGAGVSHIRWMRVTPEGGVTGPVIVASAGMEDPHGGFDPFTHIDVARAGDTSLVAFKRELHDAALELSIPKCEVVAVSDAGVIGDLTFAATTGLDWHHECRLFEDARGALVVWGAQDLEDPSDEPPTALRAAAFTGATIDASRGRGALVVTAPLHRGEPTLVDGVMAWLDQRSYQSLMTGRIELYAAPIASPDHGLAAGAPTVIGHARFVEGTAELGGVASGTNRVLVWIDERHGGSVVNPRPEVYLDTLWF
ncbi:MAG TPA: hypothetical protein VM261_22405 [Kofleriaceae bacterium]|nr:hypothetical protein [Kofleriaceae bacterium]